MKSIPHRPKLEHAHILTQLTPSMRKVLGTAYE